MLLHAQKITLCTKLIYIALRDVNYILDGFIESDYVRRDGTIKKGLHAGVRRMAQTTAYGTANTEMPTMPEPDYNACTGIPAPQDASNIELRPA